MKKTPLSSRSPSSSTPQNIRPRNALPKAGKTQKTSPNSSRADNQVDLLTPVSVSVPQSSPGGKKRQQTPCDQELQRLKKENDELKAELLFIKSLYSQLVEEIPVEKFDERRVNLLKSQVIQLERQVLLQSNALSSRVNVLLQVENKLLKIREYLRSTLPTEEMLDHRHVTLPYEHLSNLISIIDGAMLDLHKSAENGEVDNVSLPVTIMGDFLKQSKGNDVVNLLDVCSGKVEHLNLKHVSRLESKLCKLYKNMICLKENLQCNSLSATLFSGHVAQPIRDRLSSHVTTVTDLLKDCTEDLLSLSVLYPAAPWPPLKKVIHKDVTEESIMSHMPDLSRKKQQEVQSVVQAVMKSVSYSKHMLSLEVKILKKELSFHQNVYECQVNYAETLLSAVSDGYREFESNLKELLCKPLEDILKAYTELKDTASEDGLRNFLSKFKDHAGQGFPVITSERNKQARLYSVERTRYSRQHIFKLLSDALQSLVSHSQEENEGVSALSQFHIHFLDCLHSLTRQHVANRDKVMRQLLNAKDNGSNETTVLSDVTVNTPDCKKNLEFLQDSESKT